MFLSSYRESREEPICWIPLPPPYNKPTLTLQDQVELLKKACKLFQEAALLHFDLYKGGQLKKEANDLLKKVNL